VHEDDARMVFDMARSILAIIVLLQPSGAAPAIASVLSFQFPAMSGENPNNEMNAENPSSEMIEAPDPHAKAKAAPKPKAKAKAVRGVRPRIDLDETIEKAQTAFREAQKAMAKARAEARYEKRKKARIYKKCAQLSAQDLERIAVLKRSGMWDPALQGHDVIAALVVGDGSTGQTMATAAAGTATDSGGSASSGLIRDVPAPVLQAAAPPEPPNEDEDPDDNAEEKSEEDKEMDL
jgi:hypothetical protein